MMLIWLTLLAATGLLLWLVRPHRHAGFAGLAAAVPALAALWLVAQIPVVASSDRPLQETLAWMPSLGLDLVLRLDGLSLLFGLLITGIGSAIAYYTHWYLEDDPRQGYFYAVLFGFMVSMLGLVWADNLLALFVFWEGTSITSYLLIAYAHDQAPARNGARNALIVTGVGGLAMLAGFILLGQEAGTYTISQILVAPGLAESPLVLPALLLIFLGAFTKSAQFPFHFWLPGAMAAPTPASAYLHSATMVKAGVFLLARLHPAFAHLPLWFWALFLVGGATMVVGAVGTFGQRDMKALLAYATIAQLGVLTFLLAFSKEAAAVALVVGILAHALYKGPLFLIAGIVDHATGTRDLRRLARLHRDLPLATALALLAGLSMAGIPPLFGFLAKEGLLEVALHADQVTTPQVGWIALGLVGLTSALFVAYSLTLLWEAFLRPESEAVEQAHVHHPPNLAFQAAPLALVLLGTLAPFTIGLWAPLVDLAAGAVLAEPVEAHLALWRGFNPVLWTSLALMGAGLVLFLARTAWRRLLHSLPQWTRAAYTFEHLLEGLAWLADQTARAVQLRTLANQASVVMVAALVPLVIGLGHLDTWQALQPDPASYPNLPWAEVILAVLAMVAAVVTIRAQRKLGAIISLGVVGITVTLFYVFFGAPDLALTQLLIEVLTVVLLVLVFYRLPEDQRPPITGWRRVRNLVVAGAAGLLGAGMVLVNASASLQVDAPISRFFLERAFPEAHGQNVVNVILVDFRSFDTMGEITVLALAALGGYALYHAPPVFLPSRLRREAASRATADRPAPEETTAPTEARHA